jgi:hypothetical protein
MADKYPTINGNWSNPLIWNGLSLPTAGDDVYADGKAVVIDQNVDVLSIRTTQRSGGTVGGSFTISSGGFTINATASQGIYSASPGHAIIVTATSGTININAVVLVTGTNNNGISITGAGCTVNLVGNLTSTGASTPLSISAASTVNITGNLSAGTSSVGCNIQAAATLTVTGNVTGGTNTNGVGIQNTLVAATINITGNVTAQSGTGISSAIASIVTVKGIVTSSNTIAAISLSSTSSSLTFSGQAINNNNVMAIFSAIVRLYTNDPVQWTFQNNTGGNKILYSAGTPVLGNPATTDVRNGTIYGASNELTGTLIVPNPSNVVAGVQTDNTVGTYSTTPALIATEIFTKLLSNSDFNTAGSFGKLIKDNVDAKSSEIKAKTDLIPTNPASVQSVGAIVASYNV